MAYSVERLLEIFRLDVDDNVETYLWSDDEFFEYLNEAQREFCRKTEKLKAKITATITADTATVDVPEYVIRVRRAQTATDSKPLVVTNLNELDDIHAVDTYGVEMSGDWTTKTGTPRLLVMDEEEGKGRMIPIPTADDTMTLWVARLPTTDIEDDGSSMEITDPAMQRCILDYVKYLAYSKQDSATYNPQEAHRYLNLFEEKTTSFKEEIERRQRKPGTVRYGGL